MYNTALSTSKSGADIRKHLIIELYWHCNQSTGTGTAFRSGEIENEASFPSLPATARMATEWMLVGVPLWINRRCMPVQYTFCKK